MAPAWAALAWGWATAPVLVVRVSEPVSERASAQASARASERASERATAPVSGERVLGWASDWVSVAVESGWASVWAQRSSRGAGARRTTCRCWNGSTRRWNQASDRSGHCCYCLSNHCSEQKTKLETLKKIKKNQKKNPTCKMKLGWLPSVLVPVQTRLGLGGCAPEAVSSMLLSIEPSSRSEKLSATRVPEGISKQADGDGACILRSARTSREEVLTTSGEIEKKKK